MNLWQERNWSPMLLKEIPKPFDSKDYIYEIKFDGIRACIFVSPKHIEIKSRNNKDLTYLYPELASIKKLVTKNTILDGEIIVMSDTGPSFSLLQKRSHLKNMSKIKIAAKENPVIFVVFDILYQDKDLTNLKLVERKKILDNLKENDYFIKSKTYTEGIKLFENIKKLNLEGIVAKKKDSIYEINTRSNNWLKIKNINEDIFIIGGYILKKTGYISLLLGEKINNKLYYVGSASITNNNSLYEKILNSKKVDVSPFYDYKKNNVIYLKPNNKCLVKYLERTKENHLRQPIIVKEKYYERNIK